MELRVWLARLPSAVHNLLDHIITLEAPALLTAVGPALSPPSAAANKVKILLGFVIATLHHKGLTLEEEDSGSRHKSSLSSNNQCVGTDTPYMVKQ